MLCRDSRSGGHKGGEWILQRSYNSKLVYPLFGYEDKLLNRQLGQSLNFQFNPHVAFHSQLVLIFRIAHCNLYVYIQMHYTYPQFLAEDLGYHCSYFVC